MGPAISRQPLTSTSCYASTDASALKIYCCPKQRVHQDSDGIYEPAWGPVCLQLASRGIIPVLHDPNEDG
eukprot:scaffold24255_cov67-Skeletonema_dohrnii-CCMP3373.AAC.1